MRYLMAVFIATLLATGMAQAWYWSPPSCVLPPSDSARTADNNARCIAGTGDTMHVVFVRNTPIGSPPATYLKVYYSRSTNLGLTWTDPHPVSNQEPYDSRSPSIGMWDNNNLLVIWNDGDDANRHLGVSIQSNQSTNGGQSWRGQKQVNTNQDYLCSNPALFCDTCLTSVGWTAEAIWRESTAATSPPQRICQNAGYLDAGAITWYADEKPIPDAPLDVNYPSVWSCESIMHVAFERCDEDAGGRIRGDTLLYDSIPFPGSGWPQPERVDIPNPSNPWRCGHPSIECDGLWEVIAYEKATDVVGRDPGNYIAYRGWNNGSPSEFVPRAAPAEPSWMPDSTKRPQLFGIYTDGAEKDSVFMSGTGFFIPVGSELGKRVYVVSSNDAFGTRGDVTGSTTFPAGTDSCSLWAGLCGTAMPEVKLRRVWVAATYHAQTATANSTVLVRTATDQPLTTQVDAQGLGARQIARQPGTDYLHRVRTMANFTSYERSGDNGTTWEYQNAPDFGTNPTLALYDGNPLICYLRSCSVFCARLNSDSEWTIKTIFAGSSTYRPGIPSLAVFPNAGAGTRMANACFPVYDNTGSGSLILLAQFDTAASGGVVLDTIDANANSKADSAVTVAVGLNDTIEVCFEHGDSIYYKYLQYSPSTDDPPGDWTKYTLVNTGSTNAQHPYAEKVGDRFYVTFSEHWNPGAQTVWAIKRTSCCDTATAVTWEGTVSVSNEDPALKDFPSMSTGMVVAWAESSSTTTHWVIETRCGDSLLTLTDPDTNCKFVSILADTAVQTSPSTSTTGIYYLWLQQYSGDTWQVPYASKQVQTSNADANVTMYNQGRKLVRDDNDSLHAVYRTDQGSLYYGKKKDGVEGWTSALLRNTGDMPAVDCDYLNRVWVADRDLGDYQESDVIRCQTRAAGTGAWTDFQVYSRQLFEEMEGSSIGPPAIVACLNDTDGQNRSAAYIVFAVYEPGMMTARSTICMAKVNTSGVVYVDTLRSVMNHDDSFPSISLHPVAGEGYAIHVSWQEGTEVYVKKTLDQDQPQYTTKRTWSSNYNLSNTAANSRHPQIVADDTVLVAWVEGDSGAVYVKGQAPGSDYDAWDAPVNVSACPDTVCDYPSIALGDSNIVTYQKKLSSTNYDVIARVNFHSNLNLSNSTTNSKYPHCVFHLHKDSFPVISTVWTEELSANYAEVGYKRWQLGEADGGGIQNAGFLDPNIHPCLCRFSHS